MYSRTKSRNRIALFLLIIMVVVGVSYFYLGAKEGVVVRVQNLVLWIVTPIQKGVNYATGPFRRARDYVASYNRIAGQNRRLARKNRALRRTVKKLKKFEQENRRLRILADFRRQAKKKTEPAWVVSRSPSSWQSQIVIDIGSSNGIQKDMAVITDKGVVGKTVRVLKSASLVQLLNDRRGGAAVEVKRTGETAVVEGSVDGSLKMRFLADDADVNVGDKITTSGVGGVYPRGLVVGRVKKITKQSYSAEKTIKIKSAVNFSRLSEVLVITDTPPVELLL